MSRRHEPTVTRMARQNGKTLLHRDLTTSVIAGCDTRTLRVWCPRAAAPGSATNKTGKTPLVQRTGQSIVRNCREMPTDHEAPRQREGSDGRKSPEVADVRHETAERCFATSTAEQGHGARLQRWQVSQILTTCEERAWKPSKTRPLHVGGAAGSRRLCLAQDSAGTRGIRRQNSQGWDPRTQERKERTHSGKKRTYSW